MAPFVGQILFWKILLEKYCLFLLFTVYFVFIYNKFEFIVNFRVIFKSCFFFNVTLDLSIFAWLNFHFLAIDFPLCLSGERNRDCAPRHGPVRVSGIAGVFKSGALWLVLNIAFLDFKLGMRKSELCAKFWNIEEILLSCDYF